MLYEATLVNIKMSITRIKHEIFNYIINLYIYMFQRCNIISKFFINIRCIFYPLRFIYYSLIFHGLKLPPTDITKCVWRIFIKHLLLITFSKKKKVILNLVRSRKINLMYILLLFDISNYLKNKINIICNITFVF